MILQKASVCPLDCPDTCSLAVTVSGDQVLAVRGSKVNPITHGAICAKVANSYPEFVHGPNRLRYPLRRIGPKGKGNFERTSWDQALDIIHDRVGSVVERYGPQAVLPLNYAGPHGMLAGDSMSLRFFTVWAPHCSVATRCAAGSAAPPTRAPSAQPPAPRCSR